MISPTRLGHFDIKQHGTLGEAYTLFAKNLTKKKREETGIVAYPRKHGVYLSHQT